MRKLDSKLMAQGGIWSYFIIGGCLIEAIFVNKLFITSPFPVKTQILKQGCFGSPGLNRKYTLVIHLNMAFKMENRR